jgi:glucose-6-phosphate isomerase
MLNKLTFSKNFRKKKNKKKIRKDLNKFLKNIIDSDNQIIKSLSKDYKDNFQIKKLNKFKKSKTFRLIGMGGSTLGAQSIYSFLKKKIKKKFIFIDNLADDLIQSNEKNLTNIIISKSGNTIETIINSNVIINRKNQNIFITEDKKSYLFNLAEKLKAEIIHHNNYIGGRYSVLSEVGMLPAELMGLNSKKFRQFNSLIKNNNFFNILVDNVLSTYYLIKKNKNNSIILNYDENSNNLFQWYQQLISESLGKKSKGLLPIISTMPKDNHSLMQHYLGGVKNNFFTFFYVHDKKSNKINDRMLLPSFDILKNKRISEIRYTQKTATENIFRKKNIPFRSFEINGRSEEILGELFCFFLLETILLGYLLEVNPYDQPSVELIKKETKKILVTKR